MLIFSTPYSRSQHDLSGETVVNTIELLCCLIERDFYCMSKLKLLCKAVTGSNFDSLLHCSWTNRRSSQSSRFLHHKPLRRHLSSHSLTIRTFPRRPPRRNRILTLKIPDHNHDTLILSLLITRNGPIRLLSTVPADPISRLDRILDRLTKARETCGDDFGFLYWVPCCDNTEGRIHWASGSAHGGHGVACY